MALFHSDNPKEKQHSGILGAFSVDVIKWEPESDAEASIIAHKFEYEDFPNGSYLIVGPSQMAVFTNNMAAASSMGDDSAGQAQVSTFIGPCKIKLETGDSRFAPFRNIAHKLTGGESAFHSTVYFINTTYMNDLAWGTQNPIVVTDPEEEVNVHVRAFGMFGVHIEQTDTSIAPIQARKFLQKVVGTRADYTRDELLEFMRSRLREQVPTLLGDTIVNKHVSVLKISPMLSEFSTIIHESLKDHFNDFGMTLDHFAFHSVNVPDEDLRIINEAKIARKKKLIEAEGTAGEMDLLSEAEARKRQREGYTYQQERSFDVMGAAAKNEGTSSTFMGAGMGLGMGFGMGGAIREGMGEVVQNSIGSATAPQSKGNTCPKCGAACVEGAKFCLECGEKLAVAGVICPNCGKELPAGAKFCFECGQKLLSACPNCGKELVPGAKFCLECGTKI